MNNNSNKFIHSQSSQLLKINNKNEKQKLNIHNVKNNYDSRTTIMIKNIPNK